jgi:hypothetical protein
MIAMFFWVELYPEWSVGAMPHVPHNVRKIVADALYAINVTHYAAVVPA